MTQSRFRETTVGDALKGSIGPLMRQIRKYAALKGVLNALPEELGDLAAPYDVRLAAKEDGPAPAELHTLFVYVASPTVATVIALRARPLIEAANAAAGLPLVEDLRCELAPQAKIARQLNILRLKPD